MYVPILLRIFATLNNQKVSDMEKSEYHDNGIDTRTGLPWGETEDNTPFLDKVAKYMRDRYDHFVKTNGSTPKFAHVVVEFDDDENGEDCPFDTFDALIKLRDFNPTDTENDPDDENVIYYANGIDELCQINTDRTADFAIVDILGFCDTY